MVGEFGAVVASPGRDMGRFSSPGRGEAPSLEGSQSCVDVAPGDKAGVEFAVLGDGWAQRAFPSSPIP